MHRVQDQERAGRVDPNPDHRADGRSVLGEAKKRISSIPHNGISTKRYLLMEHHARWFLKYAGQNLRPIHKTPRNFFAN